MTSIHDLWSPMIHDANPPTDQPDPSTVELKGLVECRDWVGFGLGSNLGDRQTQLSDAVFALTDRFGALKVAPLYRTAPISAIPQDDYLNTVALARLPSSELSVESAVRQALDFAKALERAAGRLPSAPDSPRPLDVDLLFWGEARLTLAPNESVPEESVPEPGQWPGPIEIPHPRLTARRFVLAPLCDLAPKLRLPSGERVSDLLKEVDTQQAIRISWEPAGFTSKSTG